MHKRHLLFTGIVSFVFGTVLGVLSKLLDINAFHLDVTLASNLGSLFSEMSIWILLGTLISIFSKTKRDAAIHVFLFCIGMLAAYYITAEVTSSIYGMTFVYGWIAFSLLSPVFAILTWLTKEKGVFPKIIAAGIILVTLVISFALFAAPDIFDLLIIVALIYFLYFHKVNR